MKVGACAPATVGRPIAREKKASVMLRNDEPRTANPPELHELRANVETIISGVAPTHALRGFQQVSDRWGRLQSPLGSGSVNQLVIRGRTRQAGDWGSAMLDAFAPAA